MQTNIWVHLTEVLVVLAIPRRQCWHLNILTVDIPLHKTFVKEAFDKIQHPFILKSIGEIRDTGHIPKQNQSIIQQAHRHHQGKWRKTI